jgi:hypothetical protein
MNSQPSATLMRALHGRTSWDRRVIDELEIEEALNAWLGTVLTTLMHAGVPLWDGDPGCVNIRQAKSHEAQRWMPTRLRQR